MNRYFSFKLATIKNADLLYEWRTDPLTREMSLNTHKESYENHLLWLETALKNPQRQIYLYFDPDFKALGTVRCDQKENFIEISWTINPHYRGKGFGKQMLAQFIQKNPGYYRAQVKIENMASQKICESAGFVRVDQKDDLFFYEKIN